MKIWLKISPHKCQFFKKKMVYMGLEFQVKDDKVCYKFRFTQNIETNKSILQYGQLPLLIFTKF